MSERPQENVEKAPETPEKNPEVDRHLIRAEISSQQLTTFLEKFGEDERFAGDVVLKYAEQPEWKWKEVEHFGDNIERLKKNPPKPEKLKLPANTTPERYVREAYAKGMSDPTEIAAIAVCGLLTFSAKQRHEQPDRTYTQAVLSVSLPELNRELDKL